jgi:hypothetical protein
MDALSPPRACDPWAVRAAQTHLRGKKKAAVLTDLQQRIVGFIQERGKAEGEAMEKALGLTPWELRRELATLRHMEIVRGLREKGHIFYTLFGQN